MVLISSREFVGFKCIRNPSTPRAWLSPNVTFIFTSWSKFSSVAPSAEWSLKEIPHWIACCQEEEMGRLEEGWHVKQLSAAVSGIQSAATAKFRSEKQTSSPLPPIYSKLVVESRQFGSLVCALSPYIASYNSNDFTYRYKYVNI